MSTAFLTALVSSFGVAAVAGYGITGKLETILFYPAMAMNMALTTIVAQCMGARRQDRAKDYLCAGLGWGGGLLALLSLLIIAFARPLAGLFLPGENVAGLVSRCFQMIGAGYLLNMVTNCLLGALNGLGRPGMGMWLMLLYYVAVRMPLAWLLHRTPLGLDGIWLAVLASHIVASLAAALLCRKNWHRAQTAQGT